jgi:hypothetical protein
MQSPFIIFPDARIIRRSSSVCRDEEIYNAYYNGTITSRDLKMLAFLVKHKVATVSQLARSCYAGMNKAGERLRRFAGWRLVDSFYWVDGNKNTKPVVYCPGPGGLSLLQECHPASVHINRGGWHKRTVYDMAAILLANEFFIRTGAVLRDFVAEPGYKIGPAKLVPTAIFKAGETLLVMRVIRGPDHLQRFESELLLYEQLIEGAVGFDKHGAKPVLLLVCESDQRAVGVAKLIADKSTITRYRISTDSNILFKPPHLAFSTFEEGRLVVRAANVFKTPFDNINHSSTT